MLNCNAGNVKDLLDFVVNHPRDLAGKRYKLSTVYALWARHGAP